MREARGKFDRRGFTLIELMVVIAIIGILSALAAYQMKGAFARADQITVIERAYNAFSQARQSAYAHQSQAMVIVDMDVSAGASAHGGVYAIEAITRNIDMTQMGGWSTSYPFGSSPISANTSVFPAASNARELISSRWLQDGAVRVAIPDAAHLTQFTTQNQITGPWPKTLATACSFCNSSGIGYVAIGPDGSMHLSDPADLTKWLPDGSVGSLAFAAPGTGTVSRVLFISTPNGLVHEE